MTDMRDKLRGYFTVASVQHYLIVDPEKQLLIYHARGEGDSLQTRLLSGGELHLDPPGLSIAVPSFFDRVHGRTQTIADRETVSGWSQTGANVACVAMPRSMAARFVLPKTAQAEALGMKFDVPSPISRADPPRLVSSSGNLREGQIGDGRGLYVGPCAKTC